MDAIYLRRKDQIQGVDCHVQVPRCIHCVYEGSIPQVWLVLEFHFLRFCVGGGICEQKNLSGTQFCVVVIVMLKCVAMTFF